jgi:hypothetical protein
VGPDQLEHGRADLGRGDLVAVGVAAVQDQAPDPFGVPGRVGHRHRRPHGEPEQVDSVELEVVGHRPEHLQVGVERLGSRPGVGEPTAWLVVGHHGPEGGDRGIEGARCRVLPPDLQVTDPGRGHDQRRTPPDGGEGNPHARRRDDKADLAALIRIAGLARRGVEHRHPPWTGRELRRRQHRAQGMLRVQVSLLWTTSMLPDQRPRSGHASHQRRHRGPAAGP